jgi:hypothetical protein
MAGKFRGNAAPLNSPIRAADFPHEFTRELNEARIPADDEEAIHRFVNTLRNSRDPAQEIPHQPG